MLWMNCSCRATKLAPDLAAAEAALAAASAAVAAAAAASVGCFKEAACGRQPASHQHFTHLKQRQAQGTANMPLRQATSTTAH
jgi:hypothetical protein